MILCGIIGLMIIFIVPVIGICSVNELLTSHNTEQKIIAAILLFMCIHSIIWFCGEIKKEMELNKEYEELRKLANSNRRLKDEL